MIYDNIFGQSLDPPKVGLRTFLFRQRLNFKKLCYDPPKIILIYKTNPSKRRLVDVKYTQNNNKQDVSGMAVPGWDLRILRCDLILICIHTPSPRLSPLPPESGVLIIQMIMIILEKTRQKRQPMRWEG